MLASFFNIIGTHQFVCVKYLKVVDVIMSQSFCLNCIYGVFVCIFITVLFSNFIEFQITHRDHFPQKIWKKWRWRTVNDLYLNGAFFVASGDHSEIAQQLKKHMVQAKDGSAVGLLTRYAGMLTCTPARPC